jgi:hypothetical protein
MGRERTKHKAATIMDTLTRTSQEQALRLT